MEEVIFIKSSALKTVKDLTIINCNIEVCALLFGVRDSTNLICKAKKINNIYGSPFEFGISRRAFEHSLNEEPLPFIGIYHSHPFGYCDISQSDVNLIKSHPRLLFLIGSYSRRKKFALKCYSNIKNSVFNHKIKEET